MKQLLKISEFSALSDISRKALIYYDEIGLLKPEKTEKNGYRLYAYHQLDTVSVIGALREIGMPLTEIKHYLDQRTPDTLLNVFAEQKYIVEQKIQKLRNAAHMIDTRLAMTAEARRIDLNTLELKSCDSQYLFVSNELKGSTNEELEKETGPFYDLCNQNHLSYGYPFGTILSCKHLKDEPKPCRFFFRFPPGETCSPAYEKPAGLYLTGYVITDYYGRPSSVYHRMDEYMKKNGFILYGNCYEEFLLDEIAVKSTSDYLLQISVQVKKAK